MGNWQWGSFFFQPSSVTATSAAAGYPASRVAVLDNHPLIRPWRSTVTTTQDVILDMGSVVTAAGFAALNLNVLTVQLRTSVDGASYTPLPGSPFTLTNDIDGFYKLFVASAVSYRYLMVRIPAQTPITSVGYFEVGMIVCVRLLNTFPTNPEPDLVETIVRPYLRSLHTERAPVGENQIVLEFQMTVPISQNAQHRTLAFLGQHTPILFFKNDGVTHEVGLYRSQNNMQGRTGSTTFRINATYEEMI